MALLNVFWTVVLEKTLESPLDCKDIQSVHPEGDQSWVFIGRTEAEAETSSTLANSCEELTHWKRSWCWEGLGAGGGGDDRGRDGWMASPTLWAWVWVNSGSWWWTGRPSVLQFVGSQRVGHNSVTELNWTELNVFCTALIFILSIILESKWTMASTYNAIALYLSQRMLVSPYNSLYTWSLFCSLEPGQKKQTKQCLAIVAKQSTEKGVSLLPRRSVEQQ